MSHVGNGAVNGAKIKSTSQAATIRESMTMVAQALSNLHARRAGSHRRFSGRFRDEPTSEDVTEVYGCDDV
jgi:hypothetical protein